MSATLRNVLADGVVLRMPESRVKRVRPTDGDPTPKPVSIARIRRQREADEALLDAQRTYNLRVSGW